MANAIHFCMLMKVKDITILDTDQANMVLLGIRNELMMSLPGFLHQFGRKCESTQNGDC